jgi:NAD+ synthase
MSGSRTINEAERDIDLTFAPDELAERRQHIVRYIRSRTESDEEVILGLSGGVDSSLVAFLSVEALGTENVHAYILPTEVNSAENMSDAEWVAEHLEITYDEIGIEPVLSAYFEDAAPDSLGTITKANHHPRVRVNLLHLLADHREAAVTGTTNRTEYLLGLWPKFSDDCVDLQPIQNLYKQQVRQLASHVGVPDRIVSKSPTPETIEGVTDEDKLGVRYDTIDSILALHVDGPLSVAATARLIDVEDHVVEYVGRVYEETAEKREKPSGPDRP